MRLAGNPLKGKELTRLKKFLERMNLAYDEGIEYSICILDDDCNIVATGSAKGNVLTCIAVEPQSLALSGAILSALIQYEFEQGRVHLFVDTKPENRELLEEFSFYPILETRDFLFMENRSNGFSGYLEAIRKETPAEAMEDGMNIGAVVMNCDPFTLGHRYLLEQAAGQCDYVHVFVDGLTEQNRRFQIPARERLRLVKEGARHIPNLIFHQTYRDAELFAARIAPRLHIRRWFAGMEPDRGAADCDNRIKREMLSWYQISLIEIPRLKNAAGIISASAVRENVKKGKWMKVGKMVPDTTLKYLKEAAGMAK